LPGEVRPTSHLARRSVSHENTAKSSTQLNLHPTVTAAADASPNFEEVLAAALEETVRALLARYSTIRRQTEIADKVRIKLAGIRGADPLEMLTPQTVKK